MFRMQIESQLAVSSRTVIGGHTEWDGIPEEVVIDGQPVAVLDVPYGIKPPFFFIEIKETAENLIGKLATA